MHFIRLFCIVIITNIILCNRVVDRTINGTVFSDMSTYQYIMRNDKNGDVINVMINITSDIIPYVYKPTFYIGNNRSRYYTKLNIMGNGVRDIIMAYGFIPSLSRYHFRFNQSKIVKKIGDVTYHNNLYLIPPPETQYNNPNTKLYIKAILTNDPLCQTSCNTIFRGTQSLFTTLTYNRVSGLTAVNWGDATIYRVVKPKNLTAGTEKKSIVFQMKLARYNTNPRNRLSMYVMKDTVPIWRNNGTEKIPSSKLYDGMNNGINTRVEGDGYFLTHDIILSTDNAKDEIWYIAVEGDYCSTQGSYHVCYYTLNAFEILGTPPSGSNSQISLAAKNTFINWNHCIILYSIVFINIMMSI